MAMQLQDWVSLVRLLSLMEAWQGAECTAGSAGGTQNQSKENQFYNYDT